MGRYYLLHPRRVLSREGERLRRRCDRNGAIGLEHHVQTHPAEQPHSGDFVCTIYDRGQYRRTCGIRLSWLRPAGTDAELGRTHWPGYGEPYQMVAGVLPVRCAVRDVIADRVRRRG